MKKIYAFLLITFLGNYLASGQTADLRLVPTVNCTTNKLEVTIQIKSQAGTLKIGTSSILLNYNSSAIGFSAYQSLSFDKNDLCIANAASSWDDHASDGANAGTFNLTMSLLSNDFSCPEITTNWIDVGKLTFNINNLNLNPQLVFDLANTNFNSVPLNDGSNPILKGIFTGYSPSALSCSSPCDLNAGIDKEICSPISNYSLIAVSGTGTWSAASGNPAAATVGTTSGEVIGMTAIGNYQFILSNISTGCSDTLVVVVKDCNCVKPIITTTNPAASCSTVNLTSSVTGCIGSLTFFTEISGTNPITGSSATASGTYYAKCTVAGCDSDLKSIVVTINPLPTAPTVAGGKSICGTETTTLSLTGCTTGIKWYNGSTEIAGATATTYVASTAGSYSATCSNSCGESSKATATTVTSGATPTVPTVSGGKSICGTETAMLSLTGCTTGIKWFNGSTEIAGATATTYIASTAGSYTATCSNSCGESSKATATMVTVDKPAKPANVSRTNVCPIDFVNLSDLITATSELYTESARTTSPLLASAVDSIKTTTTYFLFNKSAVGCYSDPATITATVIACEQQLASIGNFIWEDLNQNGIQNTGEPGIPGIKVFLLNAATSSSTSTFTDENGKYSFSGLTPGSYAIVFNKPFGYTPTKKNEGLDDAKDSDADIVSGTTATTSLIIGENDESWDAGFYQPAIYGSIGDQVFNDINKDGLQNATNTPASNIKVNLLDAAGKVIASDTTGLDGKYLFESLFAGTYTVQFIAPLGSQFSTPNQGLDDAKDSDAGTNGSSSPIVLDTTKPINDPARTITSIDAGIRPIDPDCVPVCMPITVNIRK